MPFEAVLLNTILMHNHVTEVIALYISGYPLFQHFKHTKIPTNLNIYKRKWSESLCIFSRLEKTWFVECNPFFIINDNCISDKVMVQKFVLQIFLIPTVFPSLDANVSDLKDKKFNNIAYLVDLPSDEKDILFEVNRFPLSK